MADQKQTTVIPKLSARQQRALEVLLVGGSDQQAADVAGVTRPTIIAWRRKLTVFASKPILSDSLPLFPTPPRWGTLAWADMCPRSSLR